MIWLCPVQVNNIFVFIRQVALAPIPVCLLSKTSWPLTFWPSNCVRVTCDMGYLCASFSLPRPLCSRVRPDVRDRQTSDGQTNRQTDVHQTKALDNASVLWGRKRTNEKFSQTKIRRKSTLNSSVMLILVLVLVLKDSLRTKLKSLSLSLPVQSLTSLIP